MNKKGLCLTCIYDKDCVFSRNFPVLYCEEFDSRSFKLLKKQNKKKKKQ